MVGGQAPERHSGALASCELYNPSTGAWTLTTPLHTARGWHTATLLPNGRVLVMGGCNGTSITTISSNSVGSGIAEEYDPLTAAWNFTNPRLDSGGKADPSHLHTATLLPTGKILLASGAVTCAVSSPPVWQHSTSYSATPPSISWVQPSNSAWGYFCKCIQSGVSGSAEPGFWTAPVTTDGGVQWQVVSNQTQTDTYYRSNSDVCDAGLGAASSVGATVTSLASQAPAWQAQTAYTADLNWVTPTPATGWSYKCVWSGTSGASQPAWPTTPAGSQQVVNDGGVQWLSAYPSTVVAGSSIQVYASRSWPLAPISAA